MRSHFAGAEYLDHPGADGEHREEETQRVQAGPALPVRQVERADDQQRVVGEQRELRVVAAADEKRRRESAADGHQRQAERALAVGQRRGAGRQHHQQRERRRPADQPVEAERGVDRQKQDGETAAGDDLPVRAVAALGESLARDDQAAPASTPSATRIDSVIHSLSKAYFRKNATPRTSTIAPTHNINRPPIASSSDVDSSS